MSQLLATCPGCGLRLPSSEALDDRYHATVACRRLYDELSAYTLSLQDVSFIHQYVVDAYAAQHSGPRMRPITITFALAGLYLACERGYSGRAVQLAHMRLAGRRQQWPAFTPPAEKAALTVLDVLNAPAGPERDEMIKRWACAVWAAWASEHRRVAEVVAANLY